MTAGEHEGPYVWVSPAYRDLMSTQSYETRQRIAGVEIIELPVFSDEGGDFAEITRFTAEGTLAALPSYRPAQLSYSTMEPGTIKAWHLHHRQDDLWFLPPNGRLLLGLLDTRENSPTHGIHMRFAAGAGKARLLFIPRGVAHGVANLGTDVANVLYFANACFNPAHPDEHRLPYDLLGADFWSNRPG